MRIEEPDFEVLAGEPVAAPAQPPPPPNEFAGQVGAPRRRVWLRSLTSRLVVGVVSLVVVLVAVIGGATYYFLHSFLEEQLSQQVQSSAPQTASYIGRCLAADRMGAGGGHPMTSCSTLPAPDEWLALLPNSEDIAVAPNSNSGRVLTLTTEQQRTLADNLGRVITVHQDGKQLRVAAAQNNLGLVVVTGLSTEELDSTLGRLVRLELLLGAAAVLLALGLTSLGVRRSLRNLYWVTGTAREVATELSPTGSGLERRVPVTEEGTEVGQLAESFNTMLAAVETQFAARIESEQRMRQFLADASHELRTPLTSIRGYAELARMQRAVQGDVPADNLDRIESEGTRMSRLVDDLLMLARGDAAAAGTGRGGHEQVDMTGLLDDAVSGSRAAFPDRPIGLEIAPMPVILGDRDQLLRAVRNLITNAAVHTAQGRPIDVRGFGSAGGVVVEVIDGGPGLPPEDAARVFERFWRADKARSRARGGSGLGMSIVAAVTQAHGGTVRFESTVEGGSTVTLWLPAAR